MAEQKKIQLYTDRACMVEASPETSAKCVILSDGNDLQKVLDNDLTNPTVVHEETSFKVGVGDINVSSSVVDGEVGRMVIKGKTYQNILPEPSTHVLTNNKEMFKVNEGLDPNVEIVDGVSKSAILSGNTLVNVKPKTSLSKWGTSSYDSESGICTLNGSNSGIRFNIDLLKTSTKYLVIFDIVELPTFAVESDAPIKLTLGHNSYNYLNINSDELKVGTLIKTITTHNEFTEKITIGNRGEFSTPIKMRFMIIEYQEGIENWDIPYFEGLQSVKMPVLKATGKNTFNIKNKGAFRSGWYSIPLESPFNGEVYVKGDNSLPSDFRVNILAINKNEHTLTNDSVKGGHTGYYQNLTDIEFHCPSLSIEGDSRGSLDDLIANGYIVIELGGEPYKSNILSTPSDLELRGIGDVKDTVNCLTGEVVENTIKLTFSGIENWETSTNLTNYMTFRLAKPSNMITADSHSSASKYACDKLQIVSSNTVGSTEIEAIWFSSGHMYIRLPKTKASSLEEFKTYLSTNNIQVVSCAKQPIVKTVDLSSSGNWEKVVFDGSSDESWFLTSNASQTTVRFRMSLTPTSYGETTCLCDKFVVANNTPPSMETESIMLGSSVTIRIKKDKAETLDQFKRWLTQNPVTVWYQATAHQDSTQVKQPIFFEDGHVQLSSGADNSLIPTLDYQAKTSNSYVMDLMKTNTRYTMKAKSASGTFTIDGTSYGAGTNGTFTTPSSMTNKLLVMSNKTNEEVMIIEGDVTDKTIPHFKGIKSAFEGEDKIEVLSTGKNLYPYGDSTYTPEHSGWYFINGDRETLFGDKVHKDCGQGAWFYLEGGRYYFNVVGNDNVKTLQVVGEKERLYGSGATIPKGWYALRMRVQNANQEVSITNVMVEKDTETNYEPYKSNITKIPLLSPLRSLPNGVCDELIIDRMKKKATLIQRVGVGVLDGTQYISTNPSNVDTNLYQPFYCGDVFGNMAIAPHNVVTVRCDNLLACSSSTGYRNLTVNAMYQYTDSSARLAGQITKKDLGAKNVRQWFEANPTTVYYQLATPVVTEIDLENFPFVYKDGRIFLNSEIAPVVEIDYSINQSQQIQSNNETLQRHELDILDLDNLIVSFVNAEYNLRLLKFDMELSMMALAE